MSVFDIPWLALAVVIPLGAAPLVALLRDRGTASRMTLGFAFIGFGCAFMGWLAFSLGMPSPNGPLVLDELSAPLVPTVAFMHLLAALTTTKNRERYFSFGWLLTGDALRVAIFCCRDPLTLAVLLGVGTIPPYGELLTRGKPTRVYAVHMLMMIGLLAVGQMVMSSSPETGLILTTIALLIRCGVVPFHCWVPDLFEHASFGMALVFLTPLLGVYAAMRMILPFASPELLQVIGAAALFTAIYAAGMATVQTEARRFLAFLFLSHSGLVLVGLELVVLESPPVIGLTGSLCLWFSVIVALGGFGLMIRAVEGRFGRLSLNDYHGLYDHSPAIAVGFLLTGLASVGFPGTVGFVSAEILVDGAVHANIAVGVAVVLVGALNGIAVLRAYFLLFTGSRRIGSIPLRVTRRERLALIALSIVILGGGMFPQPGVASRHRAAEELLSSRSRADDPGPLPPEGQQHAQGARHVHE